MTRAKIYIAVGVVLLMLGVLWNLAGSLYGSVPRDVPMGFVTVILGIFYIWRGRRLRHRSLEQQQREP